MMRKFSITSVILTLVVLVVLFTSQGKTNKLTVHIIPHSHCDPGWLQTYEDYYRNYVSRILSGVVNNLANDPTKTFIWAEISFFKLWWEEQDLTTKEKVKRIVASGQMEFVGGGWVQNDEACASLDVVVNQITDGNEYLLKYFNAKPRIAWQVDPFGHSSLTPTLFSQMGYEGLVINRIHHQLKSTYKANKDMEFVWRASPSTDDEIFTHVLHTHYAAPIGFDWEEGSPSVEGAVEYRASQLVDSLKQRAESYRTKHLLTAWGDDFKFQNSDFQFSNMDKLIRHINDNSARFGVEIKYSTLSRYFDSVREYVNENSEIKFPVYHGDFFPYADNEDSYWTGYYTSRPFLKGYHRETLSALRAAEQIFALSRSYASGITGIGHSIDWDNSYTHLQQSRWDSSLVAHHDGVTGTSKSFVVSDYLAKLERAHAVCEDITEASSAVLLAKEGQEFDFTVDDFSMDENRVLDMALLMEGQGYMLIVHNSLGWEANKIISVKVSSPNVQVTSYEDQAIPSQINYIWNSDSEGPKELSEITQYELYFKAEIPPMGLSTYFISNKPANVKGVATTCESQVYNGQGRPNNKKKKIGSEDISIENEFYKITLGNDGFVKTLMDKERSKSTSMDIKYYEFHTGRSGAYIFRSQGAANGVPSPIQVNVLKGPLVEEAQIFGAKYMMSVKLYKGLESDFGKLVDLTHSVTPHATNREMIVRYGSSLKNDELFYTDNGIEMIQRKVSGSRSETQYYPTQSIIALRDGQQEVAVLGKQVMGSTSDSSGSLELMIHRQLGQDDGRGLGEAVADTSVIHNRQWLIFDDIEKVDQSKRRIYYFLEHPVRKVISAGASAIESWKAKFNGKFSPLQKPLPENIHLLSARVRDPSTDEIALKFLNFYETSKEESISSRSAIVQMDQLFTEFSVKNLRYVSITLNKDHDELIKVHLPTDGRALSNLNGLPSYEPNMDVESANQNSLEKGVFISKVALEAAEKDEKAAPGSGLRLKDKAEHGPARRLLGLDGVFDDEFFALTVHPIQIRAAVMSLDYLKEVTIPTKTKPAVTKPTTQLSGTVGGSKPRPKPIKDKNLSHKDFLFFEHEGEHVSTNEARTMVFLSCTGIGLLYFAYTRLSSSRKRMRILPNGRIVSNEKVV